MICNINDTPMDNVLEKSESVFGYDWLSNSDVVELVLTTVSTINVIICLPSRQVIKPNKALMINEVTTKWLNANALNANLFPHNPLQEQCKEIQR